MRKTPAGDPPVFEVELPGARAVFSTRLGGVSEPPYDSLRPSVRVPLSVPEPLNTTLDRLKVPLL